MIERVEWRCPTHECKRIALAGCGGARIFMRKHDGITKGIELECSTCGRLMLSTPSDPMRTTLHWCERVEKEAGAP